MESYKQEKIIIIMYEYLNDKREFYPISNVPLDKAKFFYKDDDGLFKLMAVSDYTVKTELNENRLYIVNAAIKDNSEKFQIGYEINFKAAEYESPLPVLSVLTKMYNQLIEDTRILHSYIRKQCFVADGKEQALVLPGLPAHTVWCMGENGKMFALPVSELYGKFQGMINTLHEAIKKLLAIDYVKLSNDLRKELDKHIATLELELKKQLEILKEWGQGLPKRVDNLERNKLDKVNTIAELQSRKNLKVGDIVEVLGYYTAGDGAGHKRIITNEDDGSGVQLKNGLWANIVHNGEVNVSWFGAKGDGVTEDTTYIQKAVNVSNVYFIYFDSKTYIVTNIDLRSNLRLIGQNKHSTILKRIDGYNLDEFPNYCRKNAIFNTHHEDTNIVYKNITISNMTLDGNKDSMIFTDLEALKTKSLTSNIDFFRVENILVENCRLINSFSDGISCTGCSDIVIRNNDFISCGVKQEIDYAKNSLSISTQIWDDKTQSMKEITSKNNIITENSFFDSKDEAIMFYGVKDLTITDNVIEKCGDKFIEGDYRDRIYPDLKLIISNNVMKNAKKYAIGLSEGIENSQITITGNTISDVENVQFFTLNGRGSTDVVVSNNIFETNENTSLGTENLFTIIGNNVTISNNILKDYSKGAGTIFSIIGKNISVTDNIINSKEANILSVRGTEVINNVIDNLNVSNNIINLDNSRDKKIIVLDFNKPSNIIKNVKILNNSIRKSGDITVGVDCAVEKMEFSHNLVEGVSEYSEKVINVNGSNKIKELIYLFNTISNTKYSDISETAVEKITTISSTTPIRFPGRVNGIPSVFENKVGDIRFNSNPKEFGSVGSKYIIFGYVFDGTKWNEMRALTGN